jgi:hypothetical protein
VDALDAEGFHKVQTKPSPGVTYVAFKKPEGVVIAMGKFSNMLRFTVKEVNVILLGYNHLLYALGFVLSYMSARNTFFCHT